MEFNKKKHKALHMISEIRVKKAQGFKLTLSVIEVNHSIRTAKTRTIMWEVSHNLLPDWKSRLWSRYYRTTLCGDMQRNYVYQNVDKMFIVAPSLVVGAQIGDFCFLLFFLCFSGLWRLWVYCFCSLKKKMILRKALYIASADNLGFY